MKSDLERVRAREAGCELGEDTAGLVIELAREEVTG